MTRSIAAHECASRLGRRHVVLAKVTCTLGGDVDRHPLLDLEFNDPVCVQLSDLVGILDIHRGGDVDTERLVSDARMEISIRIPVPEKT